MVALEDDITVLYGEASARPLLRRLEELARPERQQRTTSFDENAVLLLAYPDHVSSPDCSSLQALGRLLSEHFDEICSGVHVLPPFPSSGDGGFAPIEHLTISPELGSWADISELATRFAVSLDLILNHVSPQHTWFRRFMAGDAEYAQFFIEVARDADFSAVARSRHHPPVTVFGTATSRKELWTRYGNEQVDLNYKNALVLARMLNVLVSYAERGVSGIRIDAIAFIWKQLGTSCSNLPEVIRILRVLRRVADGAATGCF